MALNLVRPSLEPLHRLTDEVGVFEHGWYSLPRRDHGYCTDDNGRALAVVSDIGGPDAHDLAATYLGFLRYAHTGGGEFRLRLAYDRRWTDDAESDDANGRAIYGIGTAAAWGPGPDVCAQALLFFDEVCEWRSRFWRATAYAVLGAAAVLQAHPDHRGAIRLLRDAAQSLPRPRVNTSWPWPDDRLAYENARLPQALIKAGAAVGDDRVVADGVLLLRWLIEHETRGDVFSFTPVGGRCRVAPHPQFDQQPVEAWAMADAAIAAMQTCPEDVFASAVDRAAAWFEGANDVGAPMIDPRTGGGFDGLERNGVNENQGAEAQLAVLAVHHAASSLRLDLLVSDRR